MYCILSLKGSLPAGDTQD